MNSGFYGPTFRMIAGQADRMEVIAENLANSNTPGFKKLQVVHKRFHTLMEDAMRVPKNWKNGRPFDPISVDFTPGPLKTTERPLDFAIRGDAFFTVEKDGKELFTRKGDFQMDPEGRLFTTDGFPVMGVNGQIRIPPNTDLRKLTVNYKGALVADRRSIDTLRLVSFPDPSKLNRMGTTLFSAPEDMPPEDPAPEVKVINGTLEGSNTTIYQEMAETISMSRAFESCQRMIRAHDENEGKMIQQLG